MCCKNCKSDDLHKLNLPCNVKGEICLNCGAIKSSEKECAVSEEECLNCFGLGVVKLKNGAIVSEHLVELHGGEYVRKETKD